MSHITVATTIAIRATAFFFFLFFFAMLLYCVGKARTGEEHGTDVGSYRHSQDCITRIPSRLVAEWPFVCSCKLMQSVRSTRKAVSLCVFHLLCFGIFGVISCCLFANRVLLCFSFCIVGSVTADSTREQPPSRYCGIVESPIGQSQPRGIIEPADKGICPS